MMPRRMVSLALFWLIACGLSLDPDTWLRDISRLGKRTRPKVENVTFWDFEQSQIHGLRVYPRAGGPQYFPDPIPPA